MAASVPSLDVFDHSDLNLLPSVTKEKLIDFKNNCILKIEDLLILNDKLKIDSEQRFFEIEKQLTLKNSQLEDTSEKLQTSQLQFLELEQKFCEVSLKNHNLIESSNQNQDSLDRVNRKVEQIISEKEQLVKLVQSKTQEIDKLSDEWNQMSNKVSSANTEKYDLFAQLEELRTSESSNMHKLNRAILEIEQLKSLNRFLEQSVDEKSNQLLVKHKEKSSQVIELQLKLDDGLNEVKILNDQLIVLKAKLEEQTNKSEGYVEKIKSIANENSVNEEHYRNEIQSREKLVTLHKTAANEAEDKLKEALSAVRELQGLLKMATDAQKDLESYREADTNSFQESLKLKDQKIENLEKELESANDFLEAARRKGVVPMSDSSVEMLSPSAAAASNLLKSGMTLTQIYNEYVQVNDALLKAKDDNKRVNNYLDHILLEIEEKAPGIKKQKEDYEDAVKNIEKLTHQLDQALAECEKSQNTKDDLERQSKFMERENHRLQQANGDLSRQVRLLIKELEEARGNVVHMSPPHEISSNEITSSSNVITEHLVTFRNIEELQTQNQRLLEVVRELSEKREDVENELAVERTNELNQKLILLTEELNEMRRARERQTEMVETIVHQRDMYKSMVDNPVLSSDKMLKSSPTCVAEESKLTSTPNVKNAPVHQLIDEPRTPTLISTEHTDRLNNTLAELQKEFSVYRVEKAENEKVLNAQIDKLRNETSDMRLQNSQLASQLDFASERYKILKTNAESYTKEISALREKCEKHSTSSAKAEQALVMMREEMMNVQERLAQSETRATSLRVELEMKREIELRLLHENETALQQQSTQSLVLTNLQAIQNNMERAEYENKTRLIKQLEVLEKENTALKNKFDNSDSTNKSVVSLVEQQFSEIKKQKEQQLLRAENLQSENLKNEELITKLQSELNETREKLESSENRLSNLNDNDNKNYKSQEELISELTSEVSSQCLQIEALKEQEIQLKQHTEQYKSISLSLEQNLKHSTEVHENQKQESDLRIQETEKQLDQLKSEFSTLKSKYDDQNSKNEDRYKQQEETETKIRTLQEELELTQRDRDNALENQLKIKKDCDQQLELVNEAQAHYQKELLLHASDIQKLNDLKSEYEVYSSKISSLEESVKVKNAILETSKESWQQQEALLKEETGRLKSQLNSIEAQNESLLNEMQQMSHQLSKMKQAQEDDFKYTESIKESIDEKDIISGNENLLQVIRFLRREKEIAETQREVIELESKRFKSKVEHLEKELNDTKESLKTEQQNIQAQKHTVAQHTSLLQKVEQLNLLSDSNRLLRDERDNLNKEKSLLKEKLEAAESRIQPLEELQRQQQSVVNALEADKLAMRGEIDRWKSRTNHLIEQYNRIDPDEMKQLITDRDNLKTQLYAINQNVSNLEKNNATIVGQKQALQLKHNKLTEEFHKQKAEVSRTNTQVSTLRFQLDDHNGEIQTLKESIETLNKNLEAKDKELEEKSNTLVQVKKIGRRYRLKCEETQAQLESKESELAKVQQDEANNTELKQRLEATESRCRALDERVHQLNTKLTETEDKAKVAEETAKRSEQEALKREEALKHREQTTQQAQTENKAQAEQLTIATKQISKLEKELTLLKQADLLQKANHENIEKKNANLSQALKQAHIKMKQMNRLAATSEINQTEKTEMQDRIKSLETELERVKSNCSSLKFEVDVFKKENESLQVKLALLSRGKSSVKPSSSASIIERSSNTHSDSPRTANIRPITTRSIQPARSSSTDTRAMASISPFAVSTTSSTPTATVMPTTHDSESSSVMLSLQNAPQTQTVAPQQQQQQQQQQQVRPTQQVQPRPVEESIQEVEALSATAGTSTSQLSLQGTENTVQLSSATFRGNTTGTLTIEDDNSIFLHQQNVYSQPTSQSSLARPVQQTQRAHDVLPSISGERSPDSIQMVAPQLSVASKRSRDEPEQSDNQIDGDFPNTKRTRIKLQPKSLYNVSAAKTNVNQSLSQNAIMNQQVVTISQPGSQFSSQQNFYQSSADSASSSVLSNLSTVHSVHPTIQNVSTVATAIVSPSSVIATSIARPGVNEESSTYVPTGAPHEPVVGLISVSDTLLQAEVTPSPSPSTQLQPEDTANEIDVPMEQQTTNVILPDAMESNAPFDQETQEFTSDMQQCEDEQTELTEEEQPLQRTPPEELDGADSVDLHPSQPKFEDIRFDTLSKSAGLLDATSGVEKIPTSKGHTSHYEEVENLTTRGIILERVQSPIQQSPTPSTLIQDEVTQKDDNECVLIASDTEDENKPRQQMLSDEFLTNTEAEERVEQITKEQDYPPTNEKEEQFVSLEEDVLEEEEIGDDLSTSDAAEENEDNKEIEDEMEENDEDDDIVILESGEESEINTDSRSTSQQVSSTQISAVSSRGTAGVVSVAPMISHSAPQITERISPASRPSHVPPFLSSLGFEDGDDSIVPSTPTLNVPPRRTDGFAEAISSPHVAGRFLFSSSSTENLSQTVTDTQRLEVQMGLDDTKVDLFEDGSGRSVPTTPRTATPPSFSSIESSASTSEIVTQPVISTASDSVIHKSEGSVLLTPPEIVIESADKKSSLSLPASPVKDLTDASAGDSAKPALASASVDSLDIPSGSGGKVKISRITWDDPEPSTSQIRVLNTAKRSNRARRGGTIRNPSIPPSRGVLNPAGLPGQSVQRLPAQPTTRAPAPLTRASSATLSSRGTRGLTRPSRGRFNRGNAF